MMFVSMVICTVWVILSKRLMARYPALQATGWILLFGTLSLIPISPYSRFVIFLKHFENVWL